MPIQEIFQRAREHAQVDEEAVERSSDFDDLDSPEGRCVVAAIREYSIDVPYRVVESFTASGGVATLPTAWTSDWKVIRAFVGYIDDTSYEIDPNYWVVRYDSANSLWKIIFLRDQPTTFTIEYERVHNEDPFGTNTIPLRDEEALAMLCASKILSAAQSYYSRKSDVQGMGADTIDYRGLAAKSRQAANDAMSKYKKHVEKVNGSQLGASHIFSWEGTSSIDGKPWIFHKSNPSSKTSNDFWFYRG